MLARTRVARLRLLSVHPALFYRPGDRLTLAELSAARLDGHVVEIGEGYMPADTFETRAARAVSLTPLMPPGSAISGASAAWVHGAGDAAPRIHHFTRTDRARGRVSPDSRLVLHDRALAPDELQQIARIPVTTPLATAITLLFRAARSPSDEEWLRALLRTDPELLQRVQDAPALGRRRPGKRRAEKLLAELLAQDVVTR